MFLKGLGVILTLLNNVLCSQYIHGCRVLQTVGQDRSEAALNRNASSSCALAVVKCAHEKNMRNH